MVLKFGGEGIGHGHPDKLSITLHDGKRELISDFGTSGYGTPDYLQWYKRTLSHNTVTVDGRDQQKSTGRLLRFEPSPEGGQAEMQCQTAYPGVDMRRSIRLNGEEMTDLFTCTSDSVHTYEYVLLFNEKPMIDGTPVATRLAGSDAHERIRDTYAYPYKPGMSLRTSDLNVALEAQEGEVVEVVLGTASGIPANPTVQEGPAVGDVAVRPCYPLILRIKGKNMKVKADWTMK